MASALVLNGTNVQTVWFTIPPRVTLPNGDFLEGASDGWVSGDGAYSILPIQWDAEPGNATEIFQNRVYSISGGVVHVTRQWQQNPQIVPPTITNAQARQWLANAGILDQVSAAITALGGNSLIKWEYANIIERNDPLVMQLAAQLGKTSADMDALFIEASAL